MLNNNLKTNIASVTELFLIGLWFALNGTKLYSSSLHLAIAKELLFTSELKKIILEPELIIDAFL